MIHENILKANGFKKFYPDSVDKAYFYWLKKIRPHHFRGLHIIIDKTISVYCKDPNKIIGGMQNGMSNSDFLLLFYESEVKYLKDSFRFLNIDYKE